MEFYILPPLKTPGSMKNVVDSIGHTVMWEFREDLGVILITGGILLKSEEIAESKNRILRRSLAISPLFFGPVLDIFPVFFLSFVLTIVFVPVPFFYILRTSQCIR